MKIKSAEIITTDEFTIKSNNGLVTEFIADIIASQFYCNSKALWETDEEAYEYIKEQTKLFIKEITREAEKKTVFNEKTREIS